MRPERQTVNPYQSNGIDAMKSLFPGRKTRRFFGIVLLLLVILDLSVSVWILNQDLQIVPTKTSFYVTAINGFPVSNNKIVCVLLGIGASLAVAAIGMLRGKQTCRSRRIGNQGQSGGSEEGGEGEREEEGSE